MVVPGTKGDCARVVSWQRRVMRKFKYGNVEAVGSTITPNLVVQFLRILWFDYSETWCWCWFNMFVPDLFHAICGASYSNNTLDSAGFTQTVVAKKRFGTMSRDKVRNDQVIEWNKLRTIVTLPPDALRAD
jgi:hypothetical protein